MKEKVRAQMEHSINDRAGTCYNKPSGRLSRQYGITHIFFHIIEKKTRYHHKKA